MNCSLSSPFTGSVQVTSSPCSSPIAKRCKREASSSPLGEVFTYPRPVDARISALLQSRDPLMASFQTCMRMGQIIFDIWEAPEAYGQVQERHQSRQMFVNYVVGFVMRIGPSVVTLLHAFIYMLKLRINYREARGQSGCSHRIFVSAVFVAAKHCQDPRLLIEPDYDDWSYLSGIFEADQLQSMECELLTHLRGCLSVRFSDLETLIRQFFLDSADRVVPGAVDLISLICIEQGRLMKSIEPKDEDGICPSE